MVARYQRVGFQRLEAGAPHAGAVLHLRDAVCQEEDT